MNTKATKWLNVATNLAYPIAGYFGDWVTLLAGIVLGLGSAWMHYEQEYLESRTGASILADWMGMYAFTLAVLALHTTPYVLLLLLPLAWLRMEIRDNNLIGMMVLITVLVTHSFWSLLLFAPAVLIRNEWEDTGYQDISHSLWHILTGIGYYLIII